MQWGGAGGGTCDEDMSLLLVHEMWQMHGAVIDGD
jgi:hypothetical protein